jgi:hypothetical protein
MSSIWPNPFTESAILSFTLKHPADVSISVYSPTGSSALELPATKYAGGTHRIAFDGTGLGNGLYYILLRSGGMEEVQKVMLIR